MKIAIADINGQKKLLVISAIIDVDQISKAGNLTPITDLFTLEVGELNQADPEATPAMDAQIESWLETGKDKDKIKADLMIEAKKWMGTSKETVTATVLSCSTWAQRWYRKGLLSKKNMNNYRPFLDHFVSLGFMHRLNDWTYQLVYR